MSEGYKKDDRIIIKKTKHHGIVVEDMQYALIEGKLIEPIVKVRDHTNGVEEWYEPSDIRWQTKEDRPAKYIPPYDEMTLERALVVISELSYKRKSTVDMCDLGLEIDRIVDAVLPPEVHKRVRREHWDWLAKMRDED